MRLGELRVILAQCNSNDDRNDCHTQHHVITYTCMRIRTHLLILRCVFTARVNAVTWSQMCGSDWITAWLNSQLKWSTQVNASRALTRAVRTHLYRCMSTSATRHQNSTHYAAVYVYPVAAQLSSCENWHTNFTLFWKTLTASCFFPTHFCFCVRPIEARDKRDRMGGRTNKTRRVTC